MRQAYEQAAVAAGLEVGEPELFVPFDSGIASPCSECEGALLPKCACMSTVCVALRDEGTRERRRAKDAKCATPTVRCKQCPGFKTLARTHCLSAQCVARRATKTLSKQAGGAEQVSGKQKGAETGPSGANSSAKKHTACLPSQLLPHYNRRLHLAPWTWASFRVPTAEGCAAEQLPVPPRVWARTKSPQCPQWRCVVQ